MAEHSVVVPIEQLVPAILDIRGSQVMQDADLAALHGVETKALLQAVRRNGERFPPDFMFQLTSEEFAHLRSQSVTSKGRGRRRCPPYAFTEHGIAMLSSVLNSQRAIQVIIEIIRAFVRLRTVLVANADLVRRLDELEQRYDRTFETVFNAIRELMTFPERKHRRVGFRTSTAEDDA